METGLWVDGERLTKGLWQLPPLELPAVMTDSGLTVTRSDESIFSNNLTTKDGNYSMTIFDTGAGLS